MKSKKPYRTMVYDLRDSIRKSRRPGYCVRRSGGLTGKPGRAHRYLRRRRPDPRHRPHMSKTSPLKSLTSRLLKNS